MKARELFKRFEAYGWETPSREIAEKTGLRLEQVVRLDTNTSPYTPIQALREVAKKVTRAPINEYPDTSYLALREGLSRYTGMSVERFVITNGADEGLDIVSKTLLEAGDEVIVPTPSYSMFRVATELMGAKLRSIARREDFSVDAEKTMEAINRRTKLIFLCNPNNPTANSTPLSTVEELAKTGVAVAIDEAYFEFSGKSSIELTDRYDNIIVCRTFSKAFSMAGVRVGYLVAKEESVEKLNLVRPPNSLTVISLMLAEAALRHTGEMKRNVNAVVRERRRLGEALAEIHGLHPFPSETNFILFRVSGMKPSRLHASLMKRGFVLRDLSRVRGIEGCLRSTVSTPQTNDAFLGALRESLRG
jgi:histidinol-phosphate aminotransferase